MLWKRLKPFANSSLGGFVSHPSPLPVGHTTLRLPTQTVRHTVKSNAGPGNHKGGKGHVHKQGQTSFSKQSCQIHLSKDLLNLFLWGHFFLSGNVCGIACLFPSDHH